MKTQLLTISGLTTRVVERTPDPKQTVVLLHDFGAPGDDLVALAQYIDAPARFVFPEAPLEPSIATLLPRKRWLLIGLANDELGYIIPKRQWDAVAPFAYGRTKSQYGEINSCGPEVAPILMRALQARIDSAN